MAEKYLFVPFDGTHGLRAASVDLSTPEQEGRVREAVLAAMRFLGENPHCDSVRIRLPMDQVVFWHANSDEDEFLERVFDGGRKAVISDVECREWPDEGSEQITVDGHYLHVYGKSRWVVVAEVDTDTCPYDESEPREVSSRQMGPEELGFEAAEANPLVAVVAEHAGELRELLELLRGYVHPAAVGAWMVEKRDEFGGRSAMEVVAAGDADAVREYLERALNHQPRWAETVEA